MTHSAARPLDTMLLSQHELAVWFALLALLAALALRPHIHSSGTDNAVAVVAAPESRSAQASPLQERSPAWRMDLNSATAAELEMLPGIGARRAQAIVQERRRRGAFSSTSDLYTVPGLSRNLVRRLESLVQVRCLPGAGADRAP